MKRIIFVCIFCVFSILAASLFAGTKLTSANNRDIAKPRDLEVETVLFTNRRGKLLSGWYVDVEESKGAVLLMHSVRSNRTEMIGRAKMLSKAGYSVLLFDFQAHGESQGENITFGYLESEDAQAALNLLKERIGEKSIGVIGISLGGASALLSNVKNNVNVLILEMVYSNLEKAVENRLDIYFSSIGKYLSPLLLWQLEPRLGFSAKELSPVSELKKTKTPVLIISGSNDRHTTLSDTKQMYSAAGDPKKLWIVDGATHENLYQYDPKRYSEVVLSYLNSYM